jgi:hypothetical protein
MTAASIQKTYALLACTQCGAEAFASCNCHKPYHPREIAAKAIAANPGKSNRAIADEIGVGKDTVRRARESGGAHAPTDRIGRDGKTYPVKTTEPERPFIQVAPSKKMIAMILAAPPSPDLKKIREAYVCVEQADDKAVMRAALRRLTHIATDLFFRLQDEDDSASSEERDEGDAA